MYLVCAGAAEAIEFYKKALNAGEITWLPDPQGKLIHNNYESTGIFIMEGTAIADGKTITLLGQHAEPGGGQMAHRAVWKIIDSNAQTFDMYGANSGGKEMKMMEITYTR